MSISLQKDFGAYCELVNALNAQTVTNIPANDAAEITATNVVDRELTASSAHSPHLMESGKVGVQYDYNLAAGVTLTLTANVQDSSASTGTYVDLADKDGNASFSVTVGSTDSAAAQTASGVLKTDLDLTAAKRYLKLQVTPDFSATSTAGTSDVDLGAQVLLGGFSVTPASLT